MAAPSNPTLAQIVSEGLSKAGESSPTTSLTTRATNEWMEEIKNDIWERVKNLKFLQITSYGIFPQGQSRYSNPTDYASDLVLTLLDGTITDTAQGGAPNYIDLAADEAAQSSDLIGKLILIISGTGTASASQIVTYNATTKRASVVPNFTTAPSSDSTYLIIDEEIPIKEKHVSFAEFDSRLGLGQPSAFYPIGDEDFGEFILDCPPVKQYGARLRYYANVMKIDLSSTLMSTLYLNLRNVWLTGIKSKCWDFNTDDRYQEALREYEEQLNLLEFSSYGIDLHNMQQRVVDYA